MSPGPFRAGRQHVYVTCPACGLRIALLTLGHVDAAAIESGEDDRVAHAIGLHLGVGCAVTTAGDRDLTRPSP